MNKEIIVLGSSNSDLVIKSDRIPKPGETVIGGKFFKAAGGKGANQAVAAARAGGNVTFISSVGNDAFGKEALMGFEADGINIDFVQIDEKEATGTALIFIGKNGENSIAVASGANLSLDVEHLNKAMDKIKSSDVLLMQLEIPIKTVEAAAKIACKEGVKVILNPAPAQPLSDELLKCVTILTPNELEAELLTGVEVNNESEARVAAKILLEKGVKTVIITLGSNGALLATKNELKLISGFKVIAEDTTAAGDVFNGALAVAISENMDLYDAIKFAHAAASISVTRIGAQPSAPKRCEINEMLVAEL
jgi:ribokinase